MTEAEMDILAEAIAERLRGQAGCPLTSDERQTIKEMIRAKKKAIRVALWLAGALTLWVAKDIYLWFVSHLTFK